MSIEMDIIMNIIKNYIAEVAGNFDCGSNNLTSLEGAPEVIKGEFRSDQFSDAEYRAFAKKRKYVDNKLDKDLDVDLGDFA